MESNYYARVIQICRNQQLFENVELLNKFVSDITITKANKKKINKTKLNRDKYLNLIPASSALNQLINNLGLGSILLISAK